MAVAVSAQVSTSARGQEFRIGLGARLLYFGGVGLSRRRVIACLETSG
jgi:hypothetical protein